MKILMVCLGNICRSPLAEGIMAFKLKNHPDFFVDSAGTGAWHIGKQPDERSIKIASKYGLDISGQRARQFRKSDFDEFDLIFSMDKEVYKSLEKMADEPHKKKLFELLPFSGHHQPIVPDPYYDELDAFDKVYRLLDAACELAVAKIIKLKQERSK
jgi:protein-tyrosine phosphatase